MKGKSIIIMVCILMLLGGLFDFLIWPYFAIPIVPLIMVLNLFLRSWLCWALWRGSITAQWISIACAGVGFLLLAILAVWAFIHVQRQIGLLFILLILMCGTAFPLWALLLSQDVIVFLKQQRFSYQIAPAKDSERNSSS
jgi:hypothetical protein